jgi:anthranilate phosphoribosyltransferase
MLHGKWTPIQIGAYATALRARGETEDALFAGARALRAAMTAVDHGLDAVFDTAGTGGDGAHTLNLSTAAAILLAAAGVRVAKHGNRSVSSRCGSADVVEALGIPLDLSVDAHARLLRTVGITFLMAPAHHGALRHASQARKELGVRTIFNALGPLANPARATHQLVGVYDDALRPIAARALGRLGVKRAWVVRSEDGLDEVSPAASTRVSVLDEDGSVREMRVSPESFGLVPTALDTIRGGGADESATELRALLGGGGHRAEAALLINAASAYCVARGASEREAAEAMRSVLSTGKALARLDEWRAAAQRERTP